MENVFKEYFEELAKTVFIASENYEIWWVYHHERPKYVKVMNDYLGFFRISIHAHFVAMLMALSKLYELRKDTKNFKTFIKLIESDKKVNSAIVAELKDMIKNHEYLIKKILILRSNYFAHISKKLNYDKMLRKLSIQYKNFKELINLAYDLLNKISYYDRTCFSCEDTHRLLDALVNNR